MSPTAQSEARALNAMSILFASFFCLLLVNNDVSFKSIEAKIVRPWFHPRSSYAHNFNHNRIWLFFYPKCIKRKYVRVCQFLTIDWSYWSVNHNFYIIFSTFHVEERRVPHQHLCLWLHIGRINSVERFHLMADCFVWSPKRNEMGRTQSTKTKAY